MMNKTDRLEYLLDTTYFTPETLLEELVHAMGDDDFAAKYEYICQMHGIEPDEEKFNASINA